MTVETSVLGNGLTVVTHNMPHLATTSLGVWVGTGSRHESEPLHGACHFLEHMAFKGTATRTAQVIAEEIEAVGGELNAATGLDTTAYFARVLGGDEGVALEIIADILQNSAFGADEMTREREVILQEIASLQDSPEEIAFDLLHETAFPAQALGRPIIGTPESVSRIDAAMLKGLLARHYRPGNMVISAAGAVRHDCTVRHVEALFGGLSGSRVGDGEAARYAGGVSSSKKSFEQSHVVLGLEAPSYRDERYFAGQVLSGVFGGGMSSRLFQEVREKRGLCYSIYSSAWGLEDTGMLVIHAATGAEMLKPLTDVIGDELKKLADEGPTDAEMARAKAQIKAGLLMGLESSAARAEQMARHMLVHGRVIEKEELVSRIESITRRDLKSLAGGLAAGEPVAVVVGAGRRSEELARRAAGAFGH